MYLLKLLLPGRFPHLSRHRKVLVKKSDRLRKVMLSKAGAHMKQNNNVLNGKTQVEADGKNIKNDESL
jgi:hypothetical protein